LIFPNLDREAANKSRIIHEEKEKPDHDGDKSE